MSGRHRARRWPTTTWFPATVLGLGAALTSYSMAVVAFAVIAVTFGGAR